MFLRLRRRGIELEEKTALKSISKWPRYLTKTVQNDVFRAALPHFCVFPNIDVLQPSQGQNVISCQKASKSVTKWTRYLTKTAKNDVFRAAFPHFLCFHKYCCFRTIPGPKGNFVPKGVPVGFEMAEKNAFRQINRQINKH